MRFVLLLMLVSSFIVSSAQVDRQPPEQMAPEIRVNEDRIYGKLIDRNTDRPIEAASVQLFTTLNDAQTGRRKDTLVGAMLSQPNGDFSINGLTGTDTFRIIITAIGYGQYESEIIRPSGTTGMIEGPFVRDLGNIGLEPDVQQLGMVTVTSQTPALQMGIDRKIFDVDRSLTAVGGTALDVMRNIPSVQVDVEGNVLLRGSSPQIFIDGRPTILTIDQIPADNIERVELITNPSAKFDAASSGGIINIVLKKNKRVGLNGLVSAGAGTPESLNGNINLNLRQGKFNIFAIGSYNRSGGPATSRAYRENRSGGITEDYFIQHTNNQRLRRFHSVRFGADYFIDNRNTLTFSQNMVRGRFENEEEQEQEYQDINKIPYRYGERFAESRWQFNRNNSRLYFTHKFPETGKELSASIDYSFGNGSDRSDIINSYYDADGLPAGDPNIVRNSGENENSQWTMQLDFAVPRGEEGKFEAGLRSYFNNYQSIFNAYAMENGIEEKLPLSNNYRFSEMVNAAYFTYTGKLSSTLGYQVGLRAEHSQFDGELIDSSRKFGYEYPNKLDRIFDALFPSVFLSKQVGERAEIQLNYSRRIRRPNFWQLNPFIDINDPVNLRQGNPNLRPEFTNSFEFNYSQGYGTGSNFLGVIYYRNNVGDITRYSDTITTEQFEQLNNAAVDPSAILNTFINAQSTNRLGAEFTLQHKFSNDFDIIPTIDMQYRRVNAGIDGLNISNEGFSWEAKLITNYKVRSERSKLLDGLGFQLTGEYESPEVVAQGRRIEQYSIDLAFRKEFLKDNRATFTFSVNDLFNTHRYGSIYDTESFYQDSYWRRRIRGFRITFSYKFGDAEFSFNRRGERRGDDDEE